VGVHYAPYVRFAPVSPTFKGAGQIAREWCVLAFSLKTKVATSSNKSELN